MKPRTEPVAMIDGDEYISKMILNHRKRGHGYQLLAFMKQSAEYEAKWEPSRDFMDTDCTRNNMFLD